MKPLLNLRSQKGSNHREPARRGVCHYVFYDLDKNVSEFTCANGRGAETVFAISKNRQPPTTFFNGQHIEHTYTQTCQESHHFRQPLVRVYAEYDVELSVTEKFAHFSVRRCKVAIAPKLF